MHTRTRVSLAAVAAFTLAVGVIGAPRAARADDTASLLLGAAAGIAATAIYENVLHKQQAASQVVGYTANGCAVYADGHTGCNTTTANTPIACTGQNCANGAGYGRYAGSGYGSGRYNGGNRPYGQTAYGGSRWSNGRERR